ncbi:MAG: KpsF/GutQ family sugar-phosphate isomerase [Ignavibacteria bacterium]|nr:KpsF/GutQ family sugar-phosphate isomerase [Ignavibacteria bacterium]
MMEKSQIIAIAKETLQIEIESLAQVQNSLDESFVQAIELILSAKKIVVSGIGKSAIVGRKIASTLLSIGFPSVFMHSVDALHGDIGIVGEGDLVILLSKSGSTDEIIQLVPYLKNRGAKIVSIVGEENSYLSRESDVAILAKITREACPLNIVPTSSAIVSLAIGDALAVCLMKIKGITIEDFARQHPLGQIGRNIILRVADVMHKGNNLPLIGENGNFRDAVIEITNKKLGCVCVVDSENVLKGIITDGDVRRTLQKYSEINGLRVSDVMTRNPVKVSPFALLGEALSLMERRESQINVLPVVDENNRCIGVIRLHDIVRSTI